MKTTKALILAGVTALTLGAGSAMAQEGGPSMPTIDYWAAKQISAEQAQAQAPRTNQVQSGGSDVDTTHYGVGGGAGYDYTTLANPG
jgi:hypothetical protein